MALVKDCLKNITAFVRTSSLKSDKFKMNGGVPQGSSLSPGQFVSTLGFAIEDAFKNLETIHGEFVYDLFNIVFDKEKIIPVIVNNKKSLSKIDSKLEPSKTELFHVNERGEEVVYGVADANLTFSNDSTFDEMFKWEWPMITLQCNRLQFFVGKLEDKEVVARREKGEREEDLVSK
jgi:hypothetical protein